MGLGSTATLVGRSDYTHLVSLALRELLIARLPKKSHEQKFTCTLTRHQRDVTQLDQSTGIGKTTSARMSFRKHWQETLLLW